MLSIIESSVDGGHFALCTKDIFANSCKVMFKLLCCENALFANTGRYTDVPYELRICPLCKTETEDEDLFVAMLCSF